MLGQVPAFHLQQIPPTSAPGVFVIGANCIVNIDGELFLLIEIETSVMAVGEINPTLFIRLTDEQAMILMNSGVSSCQITNVPPTSIPGLDVQFRCVVALNGRVFEVFDIENSIDVQVLVRTQSCPVLNTPFTGM